MTLHRGALAALALSALMLLGATPVAAKDPGVPLPGYQPTFVTERRPGPWVDCVWAATAMLLDKWSAGEIVVSRERLRALSGDVIGGSSFADVQVAGARLGIAIATSPYGGDFVTWPELLARLRAGGGAVLVGDDAKLPKVYGRWDTKFWTKTGTKDDHALYLDHLDPSGTEVWVMDPLAPADWSGEWVPVRALRAFAWHTSGGGLWTIMTPAARRAPFAGVKLGLPAASVVDSSLRLAWPVIHAPRTWTVPALDVTATFVAIAPPLVPPDDALVVAVSPPGTVSSAASIAGPRRALSLAAAAPTTPGVYQVAVRARERRFGHLVAATSLTVYVVGPRNAALALHLAHQSSAAGSLVRLEAIVTNTGTSAWADVALAPIPGLPSRQTSLALAWVSVADPSQIVPLEVALPEPLGPGQTGLVDVVLSAPAVAGDWLLVAGLTDSIDGPFAGTGTPETGAALTVTPLVVSRASN